MVGNRYTVRFCPWDSALEFFTLISAVDSTVVLRCDGATCTRVHPGVFEVRRDSGHLFPYNSKLLSSVFNQFSKTIDRISAAAGWLSSWLLLGMVFLGAFNSVARYLDRWTGLGLSSNTYIELQWYFFAALFLLSAAYTLQSDSHVRVDVLYGRLSDRGRAVINVAGTLLFLLPFCVMMLITSWPTVSNSWAILEQSPDPGGLARYPIKTIIPIAFFLLLLQGLAMLFRQLPIALGKADGSSDGAVVTTGNKAQRAGEDIGDVVSGDDRSSGGDNGS